MKRFLVSVSFVVLAACRAPVGVSSTTVQSDSGSQCASLCSQVGMPLDSIVIMADNVGCVCRAMPPAPAGPPAAGPDGAPSATTGAASAGGMAAIMIQAERNRQQQSAAAAQRAGKK